MSALVYTHKAARLSPDGAYRYTLERGWRPGPALVWLMLNPSTADAEDNDATLNRITGMTDGYGYGGLVVVNLYAIRTKSPAELRGWARAGRDVVGPDNDATLRAVFARGGPVVAAWGAPPWVQARVLRVRALLAGGPLLRLQPRWEAEGRSPAPSAPHHPLARVAFTRTLVPYAPDPLDF